jgi:hypothetical protein
MASIEQFGYKQSSMATNFLFELISRTDKGDEGGPYLQHIIDSQMIDYTSS